MTALLVTDRSGPLYHKDASRSLTVAAHPALMALERGHRVASISDS